jgi:hypothetical protein
MQTKNRQEKMSIEIQIGGNSVRTCVAGSYGDMSFLIYSDSNSERSKDHLLGIRQVPDKLLLLEIIEHDRMASGEL